MFHHPTLHESCWALKRTFSVRQTGASFKTRLNNWHTAKMEEYLTDPNSSSFIHFVDIRVRKEAETMHMVTITGVAKDIALVLNYLEGFEQAEVQLESEHKVSATAIRGDFQILKSSKAAHTDNSSGSGESGHSGHILNAYDLSNLNWVLPCKTPKFEVRRAKGMLIVGGIKLDKADCREWPIDHVLTTAFAEGGIGLRSEQGDINGIDFENVIFELLIFDGDGYDKTKNAHEGLNVLKTITDRKAVVFWIYNNLIERVTN